MQIINEVFLPMNLCRSKSNQRWMKLRTTVQLSGAISSTIQKKAPLKREDSFLKRFSTRQIPEAQVNLQLSLFHHSFFPPDHSPHPHVTKFYLTFLSLIAYLLFATRNTAKEREREKVHLGKTRLGWVTLTFS